MSKTTATSATARADMSRGDMMTRIDAVWKRMPSADRVVLLGHDRTAITAEEKVRLMQALGAAAGARQKRQGSSASR